MQSSLPKNQRKAGVRMWSVGRSAKEHCAVLAGAEKVEQQI